MAKSPTKSWLPARSAKAGRFVAEKSASKTPRSTEKEVVKAEVVKDTSGKIKNYRSSVSGRFVLPNGETITTVRKDVMDRALSRGEFKKR